LRVARGAGCLYSLGCLEGVFSETRLGARGAGTVTPRGGEGALGLIREAREVAL
jgi:hypothetical protein